MGPPPIFHCGLPKTGSTYLQRHVFPSVEGVYYSRGRSFEELVELLSRNTDRRTLISNENLTPRLSDPHRSDPYEQKLTRRLRFLAQTWPGSSLLLFFREPSSLIKSLYAQYIYIGGTDEFREWRLKSAMDRRLDFDHLLDELLLMPWGNVLFLDHAQLLHTPNYTLECMSRFLGCRLEPSQAPSRISHPSLDKSGARLLGTVNPLLNAAWRRPSSRLVLKAARRLGLHPRVLVQAGPLTFLNRYGRPLVDMSELQRIKEQYEESWQSALAKIYATQK